MKIHVTMAVKKIYAFILYLFLFFPPQRPYKLDFVFFIVYCLCYFEDCVVLEY